MEAAINSRAPQVGEGVIGSGTFILPLFSSPLVIGRANVDTLGRGGPTVNRRLIVAATAHWTGQTLLATGQLG